MMLWTGFLLGLFGSLHCLGMCSPIVLTLPRSKSNANFLLGRSFYNIGRTISYIFLGLVIAAFGSAINFSGWQNALSIASGILILSTLITYGKSKLDVTWIKPFRAITSGIKKFFSKFYKSNTILSQFGIGVANGFLPCGLVYVALAASIAFSSFYESAVYMGLFGMGTFPMLLGVAFSGRIISGTTRQNLNRLVPYFIAILGIIFIVRGLNLGIPYLSPDISISPATNEWGEVCE